MADPQTSVHAALRLLRGRHEGMLSFHERVSPARFIVDGRDGRLIMPVEAGVIEAGDCTLSAPDLSAPDFQLMLRPAPLEETFDEGMDRWSAYHGTPSDALWARCDIEAIKADRLVVDGDELMQPNPLRHAEPSLLRPLNNRLDLVRRIVQRVARVDIADPLVVGVDPYGIDVRARFGVVRVELSSPAFEPETAMRLIDGLLEQVEGEA